MVKGWIIYTTLNQEYPKTGVYSHEIIGASRQAHHTRGLEMKISANILVDHRVNPDSVPASCPVTLGNFLSSFVPPFQYL